VYAFVVVGALAAALVCCGDRPRSIDTALSRCAVGERPGYFVPGAVPRVLGCVRLGVSGKRMEFSADHDCINPAYGGCGGRGVFIPAICWLDPPLSRFAVRDASQPRQGVRGYAYVIWGTAGASRHVVASFSGGTAHAAIIHVRPSLAHSLGEPPFRLFAVELPLSAACASVTVSGRALERVPPRPRLCQRARTP
jgi:hypothetical protein